MSNHIMQVDITKIDPKFKQTVTAIEGKPHVRFIRYLLTKRFSPTKIKSELHKLGLSAPHEPNLIAYYLCVIDPVISECGAGPLYASYKSKLLRSDNSRGAYATELLNYKLELGEDLDMQVALNKVIRALDINELWINEIYRFHGRAADLPVDENGERILETTTVNKPDEKILVHPKRYLVDKMLLENVPEARIAEYFRTQLKEPVNIHDIKGYKRNFFNIKTTDVESRIKSLEIEKVSLLQLLEDLKHTNLYAEESVADRAMIKNQTEQRISELNDNLRTLNSLYSNYASRVAANDIEDFESMFVDVLVLSHQRFLDLNGARDRDVVDPLIKTAKMMELAHSKYSDIRAAKSSAIGGMSDMHADKEILQLCKQRLEEVQEESIGQSNKQLEEMGLPPLDPDINMGDIAGIEDVATSISEDMEVDIDIDAMKPKED